MTLINYSIIIIEYVLSMTCMMENKENEKKEKEERQRKQRYEKKRVVKV